MNGFDWFLITEQGPVAETNEDFALAAPDAGLFLVADGIGSRPAGSVASRVASETFLKELLQEQERLGQEGGEGGEPDLARLVIAANRAVRAVAERDPLTAGLGTTLSAIVVRGTAATLVHVGDSRILRLRGEVLEQLTTDHTLTGELVAGRRMDAGRARTHRLRKMLTRAIGMDEVVDPEITTIELTEGDWLLLATDGLTNALEASSLEDVMRSARESAETMCRRIVESAVAATPDDNVTAIVCRIAASPRGGS